MTPNTAEKQPNNRLLYKYLQLAYEYINRTAANSIEDDRAAFLSKLYQQRITTIFQGNTPDSPPPLDASAIKEWFSGEIKKKTDDIIAGQVDEFYIDNEETQSFAAKADQYVSEFQNDITAQGSLNKLGIDAYASYLPIHFFFSGNLIAADWGIYISEQGIMRLAAALMEASIEYLGNPKPERNVSIDGVFVNIAYQILLRHEMEHFKVESFALNAEMFLGRALYAPYLTQVYATTYGSDQCLEEALANATVLNSTTIKQFFNLLYPPKCTSWAKVITECFFKNQPPGYTNYYLEGGWPRSTDPFKEAIAGYHNPFIDFDKKARGKNLTFNARRLAMNYLCNQIITGEVEPKSADIPFFAFLPDNYFLRAENLVPIHIVKFLNDDESFIHVPTPKKKDWERLLRKVGYEMTDRGNGDHVTWRSKYKGWLDITVNYHGKELDFNTYKQAGKIWEIKLTDLQKHIALGTLPSELTKKLDKSVPR